MKTAEPLWYQSYSNGITCGLCEHYCFLIPGQHGLCANQQNIDGKLVNTTFGEPYALSISHMEDRPFLHLLPGTTALGLGTKGCNMHCPYCQNHTISQHYENAEPLSLSPEAVVKLALDNGVKAIAYSYNDPVVFYQYAKEIGTIAKTKGLKNLFQTAGMGSELLFADLVTWADGIHMDLKSFNPAYTKSVLGGNLCALKERLRFVAGSAAWLEVTTLLLNKVNDSDDELRAIAAFIAGELGPHVPWHISAFTPANHRLNHKPTASESLLNAYEIGKAAGLHNVYFGNVPWLNETRCPECDTLLLQRRDYEIFENNLVGGCCPHCNRTLEGVWS